jgi:hypothetical protein
MKRERLPFQVLGEGKEMRNCAENAEFSSWDFVTWIAT